MNTIPTVTSHPLPPPIIIPTSSSSRPATTTIVADHYYCQSCKRSLERHHFQKKELKHATKSSSSSPLSTTTTTTTTSFTCHSCKRSANAIRCHQPIPSPKINQYTGESNDNNNINKNDSNTKITRIAESGVRRRPNNFGYCTYVDKLFSMRCFADIVNLGKGSGNSSGSSGGNSNGNVFTSAKDVSESMGSIHAASHFGNIRDDYGDDGDGVVLCLCIGDGSTPRTAILASFMKKGWRTISIDPNLKQEWAGTYDEKVRGMTGYRGTLEEFLLEPHVEEHIPTLSSSSSSCRSPTGKKQQQQQIPTTNEIKFNINSIQHLVLLCVHSHVRFRNTTLLSTIRARYNNPRTTLVSIPCCPKFRHVSDIGRRPDITYEDDCIFSACRVVNVWNFGEVVDCGGGDGGGSGSGKDNQNREEKKEGNGLGLALSHMKFCPSV